MPLPKNASDDSLHRHNCRGAFGNVPPKPWEFLYYIPNPHHPIEDDEDCSAHFCLILPDEYKGTSQRSNPLYRAVALITRRPRSSTRAQGCMMFRPHTAYCTCPQRPGELETSVVNRVAEASGQGLKVIVSQCNQYNRTNPRNKGHFETWSWYNDSVVPIQAPKMVHIQCLHLVRSLTQPKFGVTLLNRSVLMFDEAFQRFKDGYEMTDATTTVSQNRLATGGPVPPQAWNPVAISRRSAVI